MPTPSEIPDLAEDDKLVAHVAQAVYGVQLESARKRLEKIPVDHEKFIASLELLIKVLIVPRLFLCSL